jgi:hypothetical protein
MINNFRQITHLLKFDNEDDFYHLQIIKRKKENPELGSNSYVVRTYCIRSKEHLVDKMDEIINLCLNHNARAYINLNRRSFERAAFHTLKKITDIIMSKDYKSARNAFESVCGEYGSGKDKFWIIDIDPEHFELAPTLKVHLTDLDPVGAKVHAEIPTKHGYHIITTPFNMAEFKKLYPEVDVHKNNPTILFCN